MKQRRDPKPGVAYVITRYRLFDWRAQKIALSLRLRDLRRREIWLSERIAAAQRFMPKKEV